MTEPIDVSILGGTGYGAGELLRLLVAHPAARVSAVVSSSAAGEPVCSAHSHLRGFYELRFSESLDLDRVCGANGAVVFSALPHGASGRAADEILRHAEKQGTGEHLRVIDLSGDLRLSDAATHAEHYSESAVLESRRSEAVYGLPELDRSAIPGARLVANPGCLATASILAAAPLVRAGLSGALVIDAKTGSSGSGRQLKDTTHHPTRHADYRAYKPLGHQHEPEILQALGDPRGKRLRLSFLPQSLPVSRGIFATLHAELPEATTTAALREMYENFYAGCPFVRVVDGSPSLQDVVGSNFCDIAVAARGRQVVAMTAIDNLVKGMAGTAIQNMNLMFGLPETTGLWTPSVRPV